MLVFVRSVSQLARICRDRPARFPGHSTRGIRLQVPRQYSQTCQCHFSRFGLKIKTESFPKAKRQGYIADLAVDGQRTLNAVEKSQYDLILMDNQMPNMDGVDVARIIREKLGAKCPCIIVLTAEVLEGDKQRFLDLGFDGYLSKPLQSHTLRDALMTVKSRTQLEKV